MRTSAEIDEIARYWASAEVFSPATRAEVAQLLNDGQELRERFSTDLEFGTGGMRGLVGAGTARMNIYNVRKAAFALAQYLRKTLVSHKSPKIAIAYDSRTNSRLYAESVCEVFAGLNIGCLLAAEVCPVPILSFLIRERGLDAGVCVTASHNPKDYNGFKVYWQHGGQVVPPHDAGIMAEFAAIAGYENFPYTPFSAALQSGVVQEFGTDIYDEFIAQFSVLARGNDPDVRAVYTPLHGAGAVPVLRALTHLGYEQVQGVEAQCVLDGDFPTVPSPNPEDPQALRLGVELATAQDAELVLATDPDCDRMGLMLKEGDTFRRIDGNQLLCVLLEYVLSSEKANASLAADDFVVKTIVTTELFAEIAKFYAVHCAETLTGFKWIGQLIEDYARENEAPARRFIFGGEESFGLLYGRACRDKDGIGACCLAMKASAHFKSQGKSWFDVLDDIYLRHGVYHHDLLSCTLRGIDGKTKMTEIVKNLRASHDIFADFGVDKVVDYQTGEIKCQHAGRWQVAGQVSLPRSDVLQFYLANNAVKVSVRPSGTEPKIKFYIDVQKNIASRADLAPAKDECQKLCKKIVQTLTSSSHLGVVID